MIIVSGRLPNERLEEIPIHEALCEGIHHGLRGGRWNIHGHPVEPLDVGSERFAGFLFDGKQTDTSLLIASTACKAVKESRAKIFEA